MVLDRHVFAVDVAGFLKTLAECGRTGRGGIERPAVDQSDHRHRGLLRVRRASCGSAFWRVSFWLGSQPAKRESDHA
jgi:hypothetical protein